jgi:hypothetical protein
VHLNISKGKTKITLANHIDLFWFTNKSEPKNLGKKIVKYHGCTSEYFKERLKYHVESTQNSWFKRSNWSKSKAGK